MAPFCADFDDYPKDYDHATTLMKMTHMSDFADYGQANDDDVHADGSQNDEAKHDDDNYHGYTRSARLGSILEAMALQAQPWSAL